MLSLGFVEFWINVIFKLFIIVLNKKTFRKDDSERLAKRCTLNFLHKEIS